MHKTIRIEIYGEFYVFFFFFFFLFFFFHIYIYINNTNSLLIVGAHLTKKNKIK